MEKQWVLIRKLCAQNGNRESALKFLVWVSAEGWAPLRYYHLERCQNSEISSLAITFAWKPCKGSESGCKGILELTVAVCQYWEHFLAVSEYKDAEKDAERQLVEVTVLRKGNAADLASMQAFKPIVFERRHSEYQNKIKKRWVLLLIFAKSRHKQKEQFQVFVNWKALKKRRAVGSTRDAWSLASILG